MKEYSIHGKPYTESELIALAKTLLQNKFAEEWEKELFGFVLEWFNEEEYITAKTSGSTGEPKPIQLLKEHVLASANRSIRYFDLKPNQTALLCMPVSFIAGKLMVIRAFEAEMNLIPVKPSSSPLRFTNAAIDFAAMTPMQVEGSLDDLERIQQLIIGGSPVSAQLNQQLQLQSTQCFATYGMTETITHVAVQQLNHPFEETYSALPGVKFETDEQSRLIIHAPDVGVETLKTNDCVTLIDDTHFKFEGRFDNVINSGGVKLHPEKIEKKISSLMTTDFFIAGIAHEKLGEQCVLVIENDYPGETEEQELKLKLKEKLDKYEVPKQLFWINSFERTTSGKVKRKAIVEKIEQA